MNIYVVEEVRKEKSTFIGVFGCKGRADDFVEALQDSRDYLSELRIIEMPVEDLADL